MTKNQKYAILSISLGILMFIALAMPFARTRIETVGGTINEERMNGFDIIRGICEGGVGNFAFNATAIMLIVMTAIASALILLGVVLLVLPNKTANGTSMKIALFFTGFVIMITGIFAILLITNSYDYEDSLILEYSATLWGIGTWIVFCLGILVISLSFFVGKLFRDKEKKAVEKSA